jgi:hypothetical protein
MKTKVLYSIIIVLLLSVFSACEKNLPEGGTYQEPAFLRISGPTTAAKNSSRTYYTYYLDDGNYVWTFPADASVVVDPTKPDEGQGKSRVTIKFGVTSGKVGVKAKGMEASVDVKVQ